MRAYKRRGRYPRGLITGIEEAPRNKMRTAFQKVIIRKVRRGAHNRIYFLISSSGAYTGEAGRGRWGGGGLISGSLWYDPFVEKLAKGLVRLLRPVLFNWFYI